jgi:hypothetical protein
MTTPEIYFAIPSANPDNCRRTLPRWREMGYKIAVLQNRVKADIPADIVVWSDHYPGWAASNNILCRDIVPAHVPIVVCGGDDMLPDPNLTAQQLAHQFLEHFANSPDGTFGVMQPHGDNYDPPVICGSPWLGRAWFTRMYQGTGGMCGSYRHFWADDELYWVARCWNALWLRSDVTQHHEHFFRTGQEKPEYWAKNVQGNDARDTQLFIARHSQGFPLHHPAHPIPGRSFDPAPFHAGYTQRAEKHWAAHFAFQAVAPADEKMKQVLARCAAEGKRRVVLFGAGAHTRKLAQSLLTPPVSVLGIVDDSPALQGTTLWNYPVLSAYAALKLKPDAVILSSDSAEDRLAIAAAAFETARIPVIRLYTQAPLAAHSAA